jgi:hypothetical protein
MTWSNAKSFSRKKPLLATLEGQTHVVRAQFAVGLSDVSVFSMILVIALFFSIAFSQSNSSVNRGIKNAIVQAVIGEFHPGSMHLFILIP